MNSNTLDANTLTPDQLDTAQQIASSANEQLDSYSLGNASRALNLSCSMMAIPGLLIVVAVFLLSNFNWVMAAITLTLVGIIAFLLANLAASLARSRSTEKYYANTIKPEIDKKLQEANIEQDQFNRVIDEFLPDQAPLRQVIAYSRKMETKVDHETNLKPD